MTATSPLVSIVIPTRGRPSLVREAIESVLAQTMRDIEIHVTIDGDDPETEAVLGSIIDPRLNWRRSPRPLGPGGARNASAAMAAGRWIAFLDDDDTWLPDKLERQLALIATQQAPDRCIVMTQSLVMEPAGDFVRPTAPFRDDRPLDEWLFDRLSWTKGGESFLQTSSLLIPAAMFARSPFVSRPLHEDWELVLRLVKEQGCNLLTVEAPLVRHIVHADAPSLSRAGKWRDSLRWAHEMGPLLTPRAFAGFCLVTVMRAAALSGERGAAWTLIAAASRHGRPTARQLFAGILIAAIPDRWRRRARAAAGRRGKSQ